MTPLAWLLGLLLPACGGAGADRVAVPPPLDIAHLERPSSPNTALAAPQGASKPPDIVTPVYPVPATRLVAALERVAELQPRTSPLGPADAGMTPQWVARSAVLNFPDIVSAQVAPHGDGASTLALYSRSVYGHSDFGVNRKRLETWLAALNASLPSER